MSEIYKHLGEIDQTYKGLSKVLYTIEADVKQLSQEVSNVAEQSTADLENLSASSAMQYNQLNALNEKLAERVDELVTYAQQTHKQLSDSIKHNASALLKLEKQLIEEIDTLTTETKQRDEQLDAKLTEAEQSIQTNQANIIKMQGVDAALDKRASQLEETTATLTSISENHQAALQQLDAQGKELAWSVDQLKTETVKHAEQLIELQMNTSRLSRSLSALAAVEKRHFQTLASVLAVLILAVGAFMYFQQSVNTRDAQHIAGLATGVTSINNKLQKVDDQLDSLNGRMQYQSPFSQFGKDSVIHGPRWLSKQPANHFGIQIATAGNKQALYQIAQRYSHYFTEAMSYYTVNSNYGQQYVLVYGSFSSESQAKSTLWSMPPYISQHRPSISRMGDIQKLI